MKQNKSIPNEMRGDVADKAGVRDKNQEEKVCPGCGMKKNEWKGNKGRGFEGDDDVYCCKGCSEGSGCTCAE